jgi:hypothetical protein
VRVPASNFAAGAVLEGMNNTVDPDGGTANQSQVPLTPGSPVDLTRDFGYRPSGTAGSISNQIWKDTDADGFKDAAETGIAGVTVDLYRDLNANGRIDPGEPKIGMTTTAADGTYTFANLSTTGSGGGDAPAEYIVDVTDTAGLLDGAWHSLGTANTNDNSQTDPYAVEISSGTPNVIYADFGYFIEPAAIGNFIWADTDGDGIQDGGEAGIANVEVFLVIKWPDNSETKISVFTDSSGYYEFNNLLLDEGYDGNGSGEPSFEISVNLTTIPAGYLPSPIGATGSNSENDSNNPDGAAATATRGAVNINNTLDFGFDPTPTSTTVVDFKANYIAESKVQVEWTATDVTDIHYYNLYRSLSPDGSGKVKVNAGPIWVDLGGDPQYYFLDEAAPNQTCYYWLEKAVGESNEEVMMTDVGAAKAIYAAYKLFVPVINK